MTSQQRVGPPGSDRGGGWWFLAWAGVGAAYALALLAAMSIGILVLPVAIVATVVVGRRPSSGVGRPGLVVGAALPFLYVAFLNRDGPGMVCRSTAGGQSCTDEWSPWPWVAIAVVLIAVGVGAYIRASRRHAFDAARARTARPGKRDSRRVDSRRK